MKKSILYIMIGLPGSGKSYLAPQICDNIVSTDAIREELTGDMQNQDMNNMVFEVAFRRIEEFLKKGEDVVFDATNIIKKRRIHLINIFKTKFDCEVAGYWLCTPYDMCLERNKQRDRVCPEEVIRSMYLRFEPPHFSEGFDYIDLFFPEKLSVYDLDDLFNKLDNFDQDNPHHQLSLGEHMRKTYELLKGEEMIIQLAGLLHDIGKVFTKSFTNSKGETTDTAHYYQHQCTGAYDCIFYLRDLPYWYYITVEDMIYISNLIFYHMHPYRNWWNMGKPTKSFKRDSELLGKDMMNAIYKIHRADEKAH